jgi:hypothetical protein
MQKKYTTIEKELISIFTVFKSFDTMLFGAQITIHTNHKNLTYTSTVNDCIFHQLNYVERFGPTYKHIAGDDNFQAGMFSRLDRLDKEYSTSQDTPLKRESINNFSFILDNKEILECFLNLPDAVDLPFALDLEQIAQGQQNDPALWQRQLAHPLQYEEQQFNNT